MRKSQKRTPNLMSNPAASDYWQTHDKRKQEHWIKFISLFSQPLI